MSDLKPQSRVTNDLYKGELYFWVSGLFGKDDMDQLVVDLNKGAWPITKSGQPVHVLGEMKGFTPQARETGNIIRDHLIASQEFGLKRVAICNASALVKMQYKRLSEGLEVEFFEDRIDALKWLRRPYEEPVAASA